MEHVLILGPRWLRLSAAVPTRRRERVRGLLGRDRLGSGEAFLFERTRTVHTVGMRFPIAVAFLDRSHQVRAVVTVRPGRLVLPRRGACNVLECSPSVELRVGDRLVVRRQAIPTGPTVPVA